jgi:hypothetical protein
MTTPIDRLVEAAKTVRNMLDQLPMGIDYDADPNDQSPEDMVAHLGGLMYQILNKALVDLGE